jgi:signal transduction histidine kinase/DNA-binding response OmpR family regulator
MDSFQGSLGKNAFAEVCHSHASVVPTESYSNLATGNQKLAMVALLQQKAMAFNNVQQLHWSNRDAEQQIKYREQFVDVLCHELRNPLSGIIGNVELLQMGLGVRQGIISTDQNGRRNSDTRLSAGDLTLLQKQLVDDFASVDAIATCAEHMKTVSDDVLNLSKLEGKALLVNERFDLKATIASVVKMFLTSARKNGVQLLAKVPTEELCVLGDRGRVSQVVINLISNALKFTGNGSIIVELSCLGPALLGGRRASVFKVAVRDTGCGLSQDEISALFQLFVQPVSRSVAEHCGSGLGLYISKHLANLMGGLLCVESKKGYGSTFVFTFQAELCMVAGWTDTSQQLSDEASHLDYTYKSTGRTSLPGTIDQEREIEDPERSLPKLSPASSISATNASVITSTERCDSGTSHVLLVDDNPIIVRVLTRILESATGLTISVSTASNGYEAIGKLIALSNSPFPIDLVLMDLEIPFLNGLKTAREIRRLNNPDGGDFSSVTQRRQAERLAATPIVGLTGNVRESRFIEARDSGMDDCLGKPIVKKTLLDLIQKFVSSPKSTGHTKSLRHEVRKIHLQLEDLTVG